MRLTPTQKLPHTMRQSPAVRLNVEAASQSEAISNGEATSNIKAILHSEAISNVGASLDYTGLYTDDVLNSEFSFVLI